MSTDNFDQFGRSSRILTSPPICPMSLYHEAAKVLDTADRKGESFKSIIFGRKDWKSNQKALYALTTEAAGWSEVLCEVIENSGILQIEKQVGRSSDYHVPSLRYIT